MEPVFDFAFQFNAYLVGKWRLTLLADLKSEGKKEVSCIRFFGDIVEM
jgi:hypothetical protein